MIPAYPLTWPADWFRTSAADRKSARFSKGERQYSAAGQSSWMRKRDLTVADALRRVRDELRRFGIDDDDLVISTNIPLRLDGLPRSAAAEPKDPGAAVYWQYPDGSGKRCIAIDCYTRVADNLAAIAATLEAMRSIERHGGAEILERAFTGFTALPPPSEPTWWDVLECRRDAPLEEIKAQYRRIASQAHPDKEHGSTARMAAVNRAWEQAQEERR